MPLVFFQVIFYTDVMGLNPTTVGGLLIAVRLFDTLNDPLMGFLADRTKTRFGKFRPYLLFGCIPLGIMAVLCFSAPDLSPNGKIIYAFLTYLGLSVTYTVVNVPYASLMGSMTDNPSEKATLATVRFIGAFSAGAIVQWFAPELINYFGDGNEAIGYQYTMGLFASLLVIMILITFLTTTERVEPAQEGNHSFFKEFNNLRKNTPFWILFLAGIFTLSFVSMKGGVTVHYFKYVIKDESLVNEFLVLGTIATLVGLAFTKVLTDKWDKKWVYIAAIALSSFFTGMTYFLSNNQVLEIFCLYILGSFFSAPAIPIVWMMYSDITEYMEIKTGKRSNGLIFAGASFSQKMGWTIGGSLVGFLLGAFGFIANSAQSIESLAGIHLMFTLIPSVFAALAIITLLFYKLDRKTMNIVLENLNTKRIRNDNHKLPQQ